MLVSYRWLQQFVKTTTPPEALGEKFLMTSSELEKISYPDKGLENIVTGKVLTCEKHPNSDKLKVTTVDIGNTRKTIICGAPNVTVGQIVLVALPGANVTSRKGEAITISETPLRGITSEGMICAADELGIPLAGEDGIWVLSAAIPVGIPAAEALELHDTVLDLEITPNRPDLLSYLGLAREVATFENKKLLVPETAQLKSKGTPLVTAHITHQAACTRLSLVTLKVLKNQPSPWWMQRHLILAGMRPLNAIVDVTNYVMLELGQPLHAYNLTTLKHSSKKIHVQAEKVQRDTHVTTLDSVSRMATAGDVLITVNGAPAGFAGIMGGLESSIQDDAEEIMLESAHFSGAQIRRTSRRLGLRTEASNRFEKGIDAEGTVTALERAVYLLESLGVAEQTGSLIDERNGQTKSQPTLNFNVDTFKSLMGVQISITEAHHILNSLGFTTTSISKSSLKCTPPTWRDDIKIEEDVVEEIIRIWGFERIHPTLPKGAVKAPQRNASFYQASYMRNAAARFGFTEVINIPFCSLKQLEKLSITNGQILANPLSQEEAYLVTTHLVHFLELAAKQQGSDESYLFEIGSVFSHHYTETRMVSALLRSNKPAEYLVQEAKRLIAACVKGNPVTYTQAKAEPYASLTLNVVVGEIQLGTLSILNNTTISSHKIRRGRTIIFFELERSQIDALAPDLVIYQPLDTYPSIERDITLILPEEFDWSEAASSFQKALNDTFKHFELTHVFRGTPLQDGTKSFTIHCTYQSPDRTLTDAEVDTHQKDLIHHLTKNPHIHLA